MKPIRATEKCMNMVSWRKGASDTRVICSWEQFMESSFGKVGLVQNF